MEQKLFRLFQDKLAFDRFSPFIKPHILSNEGKTILKDLGMWFKEKDTLEDWQEFLLWLLVVQHPTLSDDSKEVYELYISRIEEEDEPSEEIVNSFIKRDYFVQIASLCLEGEEKNNKEMDEVLDLIQKYNVEVDKVDSLSDTLCDITDEEIFTEEETIDGYEWRLPELNKAVGNLRESQLVIIGGRPNLGKTSMLAAEASHIASQLPEGKNVLWFNNESAIRDVKIRIVEATLGMSEAEYKRDPVHSLELYRSLLGDRLRLHDGVYDVSTAVRLMEEEDPGLVIIDQLWNFSGFGKSGSEVVRQGLLFTEARKWAKKYAPVICVHQLSAEADNEPYPEMSTFFMSKTAIQGAGDVILTLGGSTDKGYEDSRFLNVVKTKRKVGKYLDPRAGTKFELTLDKERARFLSPR